MLRCRLLVPRTDSPIGVNIKISDIAVRMDYLLEIRGKLPLRQLQKTHDAVRKAMEPYKKEVSIERNDRSDKHIHFSSTSGIPAFYFAAINQALGQLDFSVFYQVYSAVYNNGMRTRRLQKKKKNS